MLHPVAEIECIRTTGAGAGDVVLESRQRSRTLWRKQVTNPNKYVFLAALAIAPSVVAWAGCQPPAPDDPVAPDGAVSVRYELEFGLEITELAFSVYHGSAEVRAGVVPVGDDRVVEFSIPSLPPGMSTIWVWATTSDDRWTCVGYADFVIVSGERTPVEMVMQCVREDYPELWEIEVSINACPQVTGVAVAPSIADVGEGVHLEVTARDSDGDTLSVQWSANGVTFGAGEETVYHCDEVGLVPILVTADDGHCEISRAVTIECLPAEPAYWPPPREGCDECMFESCSEQFWGLDLNALCPPEDVECRNVYQCFMENECLTPSLGTLECFCGTVHPTSCLDASHPSMLNGPCAEFLHPFFTDGGWNEPLGVVLTDPETGVGRASLVAECMGLMCSEPCQLAGF
ncbi:MAG: hypothetical protein B7733_23380 [Myxococcales bacterium FL481]|nr:MAG: hypothetical protein B7733_23380 [Myxococcales bacterium FL481]